MGEEREFAVEGFELELRLVVELGGIEEDEEVVGSWGFYGGEVEILSFFVCLFLKKNSRFFVCLILSFFLVSSFVF